MKNIYRILILMLVLMMIGCASLREYEHKDIDSRVLGLDASIPILFIDNINLLNLRLGWVETTYSSGYKTIKHTNAKHRINYLGTSERETYIGIKSE